jgi:hypothetical protein
MLVCEPASHHQRIRHVSTVTTRFRNSHSFSKECGSSWTLEPWLTSANALW